LIGELLQIALEVLASGEIGLGGAEEVRLLVEVLFDDAVEVVNGRDVLDAGVVEAEQGAPRRHRRGCCALA
jgi:hypothetical protein